MTDCRVPRPISMLILQTPQFQTPCTTDHAQIGFGNFLQKKRERKNMKFVVFVVKTILFILMLLEKQPETRVQIKLKFSVFCEFLFVFSFLDMSFPSLCTFLTSFCQLCPTYFFQLCRAYFFQLCPKYFFAPLVLLALTNVPLLDTFSQQAKSKTPLLELCDDNEM